MMSKRKLLFLLACPLMLSACGDGYEVVRTDEMFPYGNQRTAGSGYAYVLAKMLPEKTVKLESVKRDWKPEVMEMLPHSEPVKEEPVKKADKIFLENGKK